MRAGYIVATTEKDLNGEQFTEQSLRDVAAVPQTSLKRVEDFSSMVEVGKVFDLAYDEGELSASVELLEVKDFSAKAKAEIGKLVAALETGKLVAVAAIEFHPDDIETLPDGTRVIHHFEFMHFGLTDKPADPCCGLLAGEGGTEDGSDASNWVA